MTSKLPEYHFVVTANSASRFRAIVKEAGGRVVYEIGSREKMRDMVLDCFMAHRADCDGLRDHLVTVGVLPFGAVVKRMFLRRGALVAA